jgi:hypothetical protein
MDMTNSTKIFAFALITLFLFDAMSQPTQNLKIIQSTPRRADAKVIVVSPQAVENSCIFDVWVDGGPYDQYAIPWAPAADAGQPLYTPRDAQ